MKVGELFAVDLPNVSSLSGEIHYWYTKWKSEEKEHGSNSLPSTLSSTLTRISSFYPNTKALVTILCTLSVTSCTAERPFSGLKCQSLVTILCTIPVTSCTAERSFSGLKHMRCSMSNERLSSLTLFYMHHHIPLTSKKSLMSSPDVIPGKFNFLTPLDSYLFIVLLHHFTCTLITNRYEVIW